MAHQEDIRLSQEIKIRIVKRTLQFRRPARTSRDVMAVRDVHYIILSGKESIYGIGEIAPIAGLSPEDPVKFENALLALQRPHTRADLEVIFAENPSIRFGYETALLDYLHGGQRTIFPGYEAQVIPINGLVWMNGRDEMLAEATEKISAGFRCIKLKIGGIGFEDELEILKTIRTNFPGDDLEIRLDANGAFQPADALEKLKALAAFRIHSIEQPIKAGQWEMMAQLVEHSPIPIALDEELIGIYHIPRMKQMLEAIRPAYIILKPTLHGGIGGCNDWINIAGSMHIKWWATSALESSIGLNAIAQWVSTKRNPLPQGLGTGALFTSNIPSPLTTAYGNLSWQGQIPWDVTSILAT